MKKVFMVLLLTICVFGLCFATGAGESGGAPGQQQQKTELVYAQAVPITNLEIAGMQPMTTPAGYEAVFAIFNGLVRFNAKLEIIPDLAESWTVDSNGVNWDFVLKQGIRFHDGTTFNADAVVAHVQRMVDNTINIGAASLWAPVKGAEKLDEYKVRVSTDAPYAGLLNVLAHGSGLIPSPASVEKFGKDVGFNPVGTGPYKMSNFAPGTELVVVANPDYFGPKPVYTKITYKYVADASARVSALRSGEVDVIDTISPELTSQLTSDPNVKVINIAGLRIFGIGLSFNNPLLQNQAIREAMNYAVDKESITRVIFRGNATPVSSPAAPGIDGAVVAGSFAYNQEKARSLLEGIGCVRGADGIYSYQGQRLSFRFSIPDGYYPNDVIVAEAVQSQLKSVGIEVMINKLEAASFSSTLRVAQNAVDFDMAIFGYNPSHGDAAIHMEALFASNPNTSAPLLWNFMWYSNTTADRAIEMAKVSVDPAQRRNYLAEAQRAVWNDVPYIWLYATNIVTATRANDTTTVVLPIVFTLVHGEK